MSYRNRTYVAFASEDIHRYRMMEAWRDNEKFDFGFFDAHELYVARDTSTRETIKRRLRDRLSNTAKQVVLIGTETAKKKGGDGYSFLAYEIAVIMELQLPIVVANCDGSQDIEKRFIPTPLLEADYYTVSVSFRPTIIQHALNNYVPAFRQGGKSGPHYYKDAVYKNLGLE